MKEKGFSTNVDLESREWTDRDELGTEIAFLQAGFSNTEEILNLRIYDMLGIRGIDTGRADEMMEALYRFFTGGEYINEDIWLASGEYHEETGRYPDARKWWEKHPDPSKVLVRDIILERCFTIDSMFDIYSDVVRAYWRSEEYTRKYRFRNYGDLLEQMEKREER